MNWCCYLGNGSGITIDRSKKWRENRFWEEGEFILGHVECEVLVRQQDGCKSKRQEIQAWTHRLGIISVKW